MMRRFLLASAGCVALVGIADAAEGQSEEPAPAANLQLSLTGDLWSAASGGVSHDLVFLDEVDLQLSLDLEKLTGWQGASAFIYGLYTNGNSVSELAGDFNGISNIEIGVEHVRVVEAWIDQAFDDGKGSIRAGLYDLCSEFDAGEVRALFLNSGHGSGSDFSQTGQNGPSMWPVTSLAVRVNYNFEGGYYLRGTLADGVPGNPDKPKRTTIDFQDGDGLLLAAEGGVAMDGRLWSLGVWTYTEQFPDLVTAENHSNAGAYLALEEPLLSSEAGDSFNLAGSFRVGFANSDINSLSSFFSATLVATGLIPDLPEDQIGLGLLIANAGNKFQSSEGLSEDQEINIELTYFASLTESLTIQPDIQYVVNPGMDGSLEDAFVFGVRLSLNRNWSVD
ncbi:MAG: carbohydrate porin [Micropepsaceae bacterium]